MRIQIIIISRAYHLHCEVQCVVIVESFALWAIMVGLVILIKALVWTGEVADILVGALVIDVLSDVAIGELGVVTNALTGEMLGVGAKIVADLEVVVVPELAITLVLRMVVPQPVDALFDAVVDAVVDVLTDALPVVIIGIVTGITFVDVLAEVKENVFKASMAALDFATPARLRDFSC